MYIDEPLKKYIEDLSAKLPAPGGGSAAALAGALGVSLLAMVLHFTIGKERYKQYADELADAFESAKELKRKLSQLIDEDVQVYNKVSETFKSGDGTIKEKSLKDAAAVPIEICNSCYRALKLGARIMDKTNVNLASDIGVAAELLTAAYNSALFNVNINLKSIKDQSFTSHIRAALQPQGSEIETIKKTILDFVNTATS